MSIRKPSRGWAMLVGAILLSAVACRSRAAVPEVLQQVPGDAYAVAVVGNMRTFASKISNSLTRLEITPPSPDLVGYATRSMGISAGFDANNSAALVLLKPTAAQQGENYFEGMPPAVLIVPSTNTTQMLKPFNPTEPDKDGISQVTVPDNPEEKGFVTVINKKWVVFGTRKEDVAMYLARGDSFAKTASPDTLKVFEANDLVLWGNVEKLGAGADKWLDDEKVDRVGMLDLQDTINKLDPLATTMEKHGINLVFDSAKQFFADASAGMVTVRLTDSGATLGLVADFKAGTPMGKFVASQGSHAPLTLKGLPSGKFIAAGSAKWNGESVANTVGGFLDSILADPLLAKDAHLPNLRKSFADGKQMLALTQGASFVFLEPTVGGKNGFLNGAVLLDSSDPKKLFDLQMQSASNIMAQQAMSSGIKTTASTTPNAVTIKNVPLAKITVTVAARPETPDHPLSDEERNALETIQRMYGPSGMTMYMGVVGKSVLLIYGSDTSTMEAAVAAAQGDTDALAASPEIAGMKDQLVANPVAVAYLPIARWVTLAQSIVPAVAGGGRGAAPVSDPAAAKSPPVVMSAGVTGTMVTAEIHVPIAAIKGTQDAITRMEKAAEGADTLP